MRRGGEGKGGVEKGREQIEPWEISAYRKLIKGIKTQRKRLQRNERGVRLEHCGVMKSTEGWFSEGNDQ